MNSDQLLVTIALLAAPGCGQMAGLFYAYSVSVMRALARLPAAQGIVTMQTINVVILNPVFFVSFFGTALLCALAMIVAAVSSHSGRYWIIAGGALYLIGGVLVTVIINVPKNNALAAIVAPTDPEAARFWSRYLADWTAWNHVRAAASLGATALLMIGL